MTLRPFTSESVTEGHPDKVADQISDTILDHILAADPTARVACETLVTTGMALVAGEISTSTYVEIPDLVRETLRSIGYTRSDYGIDGSTCAVLSTIDRQSPDIAMGVDTGGAGDQGMMFGYASDETEARMPLPILLAHQLTEALARARKEGRLPWLRPDGKAQVTVLYDGDRPLEIGTVVLSAQHDPGVDRGTLEAGLMEAVILPTLPPSFFDPNRATLHLNPTGQFVVGGPQGDAGLTGRKIIVDTYGAWARHGGGAFSGKDATKVDRSAAYAARWAARNLVAAGLARRCEIQLAYAIGVAEPVSILVDSFGTGQVPDDVLARAVRAVFDLTPRGIREALDLVRPIFTPTAAYGHFGRTSVQVERLGQRVTLFPWEREDRVHDLRTAAERA
jgi:S-adenosylmethionine synthetase